MRTWPGGGIVPIVDPERTRLTVELDSHAEPISGQISKPGGRAQKFSGYMGLIQALERLRAPGEARSTGGEWPAGMGAGGSR
jgi:hypothetical protein